MQFTFYGVRGSIPVSGKNFNKYGGSTSCYLVGPTEKEAIIVDSGTGIIRLGQNLITREPGGPLRISILFTHLHLDHVIGLPFFNPLYSSRTRMTFYSLLNPKSLEKCLSTLMGGRFFPIPFQETPSKKTFRQIPSGKFRIRGVSVSSCPLNHPQGSLAYRFQFGKRSVVLATDTEHPDNGLDNQLVALARGADYLVYDAMFTPSEYKAGKRGWGHSTWLEGTKVAREAGVKNLYLSHFNPQHTDKKIDQVLTKAGQKFSPTFGAQEGLFVDL